MRRIFILRSCEFPNRQGIFRHALYGDRQLLVLAMPDLLKVFAGEELSAAQWHAVLDTAAKLNDNSKLDPVKDATPDNLAMAQVAYARNHHITLDQAKMLDPVVTLGEFYVHQAQITSDELFKWRGLPYPTAGQGK